MHVCDFDDFVEANFDKKSDELLKFTMILKFL